MIMIIRFLLLVNISNNLVYYLDKIKITCFSMKPNPITKITKNKIYTFKADYSHIQSRLFSSLEKTITNSKDKQNLQIKTAQHSLQKTVRYSLEKIQQIGQAKYKQAMKHMKRFNQYENEKNKRKIQHTDKIDKQCTFKPKINNKKYLHNSSFTNLKSSISSLYGSKSSLLNKSDIYDKNMSMKNSQILIQSSDKKVNQKDFRKKQTVFQTSQRLINWGKNRDVKIINKAIQIEASRSISRQSTYSNNRSRQSSNPKSKTYKQLQIKKLNLTLSTVINQSQQDFYRKDKFNSLIMTPKVGQKSLNSYANKSSTSLYFNSANMTPRGQTTRLTQNTEDKILNKDNVYYSTMIKNGNVYANMDPEKQKNYTYGQKLLARQSDRGQGSFYLRQAKANIMKNYNKSDVLIKDTKYTKKFSIFNLKLTDDK